MQKKFFVCPMSSLSPWRTRPWLCHMPSAVMKMAIHKLLRVSPSKQMPELHQACTAALQALYVLSPTVFLTQVTLLTASEMQDVQERYLPFLISSCIPSGTVGELVLVSGEMTSVRFMCIVCQDDCEYQFARASSTSAGHPALAQPTPPISGTHPLPSRSLHDPPSGWQLQFPLLGIIWQSTANGDPLLRP